MDHHGEEYVIHFMGAVNGLESSFLNTPNMWRPDAKYALFGYHQGNRSRTE